MSVYYVLGCFLLVILVKFIVNFYKYQRIRILYKKYDDYLHAKSSVFVQYKEEIRSLFKDAGLENFSIFHQELLGYGQVVNCRVSLFDNLANCREDVVERVRMSFNDAIGVYRMRFKESFNPIFWIDFVIKLPQYILGFCGILPEKKAVKGLLVVYWIAAIIFGLKKFDLLEYLLK